MCMNCGCGQPHDDHGNAANITADELQQAGDANGQSMRESAQHILEAVELLDSSSRSDGGLGRPAAATGGATGGRGTPESES